MMIFRRIIEFLKNWKKPKVKEISSEPLPRLNSARDIFRNNLKIVPKNKVEVIKCVGDGIGIETSISN